jgi:hypothetical protein
MGFLRRTLVAVSSVALAAATAMAQPGKPGPLCAPENLEAYVAGSWSVSDFCLGFFASNDAAWEPFLLGALALDFPGEWREAATSVGPGLGPFVGISGTYAI